MRSGLSSVTARTASNPSPHSATTSISGSSWSPLRTHSRASGSSSTINVRILIPTSLGSSATSRSVIRKGTQGVTERCRTFWPKNPDEEFKIRNESPGQRTNPILLGTKGECRRTLPRGPASLAAVRPAERALGVPVVAATGPCDQNRAGVKQRVLLAAGLLLPIWLLPDRNCSRVAVAPEAASSGTATPTPTPAPDLFATTVRPILAGHC